MKKSNSLKKNTIQSSYKSINSQVARRQSFRADNSSSSWIYLHPPRTKPLKFKSVPRKRTKDTAESRSCAYVLEAVTSVNKLQPKDIKQRLKRLSTLHLWPHTCLSHIFGTSIFDSVKIQRWWDQKASLCLFLSHVFYPVRALTRQQESSGSHKLALNSVKLKLQPKSQCLTFAHCFSFLMTRFFWLYST